MAKRKASTESAPSAKLTDVIQYFIENVVKTYDVDAEMESKRISDLVKDMQVNGDDDDEIYAALGCLEPYYCDPMHQFQIEVLEGDDCQEALKSVKRAQREAATAAARADTELSHRLKCLVAEREAREQQTVQLDKLTTAKPARPGSENYEVRVGCFVEVAPDLSPGMCSHGGKGFVYSIAHDGTYAVEYLTNFGGRTESGIELCRLTELPLSALLAAKRPTRERTKRVPLGTLSTNTQQTKAPPNKRSLLEELEYGLKRNRNKGWRARDLGFDDAKFKDRSLRFKERVLRDLAVLSHATEGMSRCSRTIRSSKSGQFEQRKKDYHPHTRAYLCVAWGISEKTLRLWVVADQNGALGPRKQRDFKSLIECPAAAARHFDAQKLYVRHEVNEQRKDTTSSIRKEDIVMWKGEASARWEDLDEGQKEKWKAKSRSSIEQLPLIKEQLGESLKATETKSYRDMSADIDGVLSTMSVFRYSKKWGLKKYTQRPLPHCGEPQKLRQVTFAKHFLDRWGLPKQKILLIHFDEKWFESGKRRMNAKACDELGVPKRHPTMKHCRHAPKVMVVTVVAYAFDGDIENGGHGLKIGQYRCQKAKIALRDQREATRDSNGKISYNGPLVRKKGDAYLVDCNVTGSGTGTASDPKFALMDLFKSTIFPAIEKIVGPGGTYEGYLPIVQGDNAGPHEDSTFKSYAAGACEKKSWKWEPQAPQMPHMNVLDLAVFPSMSKAHSKLCSSYTNSAVPVKRIWETCQTVFNALTSATIAKGFVSAFRMARKVVEHGGGNAWVRTAESHLNVRQDFKETSKGIVRKTN